MRRIVRVLTPKISAACHHVIFFAIARMITSCTFIIRSISADEICFRVTFTLPAFHPLQADISCANSTGQFTC